ncbi:hypothetical protein M514_04067 [Trichuris suis]|uniref:Uncharacterized protein n=1 Tax=Trichuris suis TaxID=68888 RepID=A0A085MD53_9BILA|nr:hypothetical protein M513_04067 [Trichuris suis]KFD72497.1 hypothetical protein M514_04067 [Trichuris suis]
MERLEKSADKTKDPNREVAFPKGRIDRPLPPTEPRNETDTGQRIASSELSGQHPFPTRSEKLKQSHLGIR